ncbi:MAG: glutamate mutase L [Flavonifractor plautii]
MTQVKYIVGTGGALTRLPHREEIMREITRCNESGMLPLPGEHAQILVDHDYIMASLGVLSKRYPQAAARSAGAEPGHDLSGAESGGAGTRLQQGALPA